MEIFKILAFILVALFLILIVEKSNKEVGLLLVLVATALVFFAMFDSIKGLVNILDKLADGAGINKTYLEIVLKVTGIAYLVEIIKSVCKDAGNSALASKVEFAGQISIAVLTIPLITNVISLVEGIV